MSNRVHLELLINNQRISRLKTEYNQLFCLAFVDYEKIFGSVEHMAVFNLIWDQGFKENYVKVTQNVHKSNTAILWLHKDTNKIKFSKGIWQEDAI